jgi:hypothetical protein
MVDMRSTKKNIYSFRKFSQFTSVYLEEPQLFVFFQTQVLFIRKISISTKNTFHVNTKSNTKKCHVRCRRNHPLLQTNIITFLGKTLISMLTSKLITVDSKKNEQTIYSVISNVRTRTKRHQMQMLILNRLD